MYFSFKGREFNKMRFSILQPFFLKYNMYNRISNGILEKILTEFFTNFIVESDYEPYYVFNDDKKSITIDWCTTTDGFYVVVYENKILLYKNERIITVDVNSDNIASNVNDYVDCWMNY